MKATVKDGAVKFVMLSIEENTWQSTILNTTPNCQTVYVYIAVLIFLQDKSATHAAIVTAEKNIHYYYRDRKPDYGKKRVWRPLTSGLPTATFFVRKLERLRRPTNL